MEKYRVSLSGLHRRSMCCRAPVDHEFPACSQPFWRCEALICTACHRRIAEFEVVNVYGDRIWPVPASYDGHFIPSYRTLCAGGDFVHPIHLPKRLRRSFLK